MSRSPIQIRSWHYHTPTRDHRPIFHSVFSAGQIRILPEYSLRSWAYPGHDLLLCTEGVGFVQVGNRTFKASAGNLIWADNNQSDVSWPERTEPWEFYWVRVDSAHLDSVARLLGVRDGPVCSVANASAAKRVFSKILRLLRTRPVSMEPALYAAIASLIALIFEGRAPRQSTAVDFDLGSAGANAAKALDAIRINYFDQWTVGKMAALAGCSEPHFFRLFRRMMGSAPMTWLRQERVSHAKRRLAETNDRVNTIADYVGYLDPYYFSRDFTRLVGMSPRQYRSQEQLRRQVGPPGRK